MSPAPWVHFTFGVDRVLSISEMLLTKNWKVLRNNNRLNHVRFTFLSRLLKRTKSDSFFAVSRAFDSERKNRSIARSFSSFCLFFDWSIKKLQRIFEILTVVRTVKTTVTDSRGLAQGSLARRDYSLFHWLWVGRETRQNTQRFLWNAPAMSHWHFREMKRLSYVC